MKKKTKKKPIEKPVETEVKSVGRPSAMQDEKILDQRIRIWIAHFYRKLPYWELAEQEGVSASTVKKAIEFVQKNFVKIPTKAILQGAIFSIEERIKKITNLLEIELGRKEPSIRNVKELNSEIRSDEIELNKLKNIYQEKYSVEIEGGGSIREILSILSAERKKK